MRSAIFPSFTFAKRGIFYFGRRVPKDVRRFYGSPRVVLSLRTKSVKRAERQAQRIAAKLEEQWDLLRLVHLQDRVGNNRLEVPSCCFKLDWRIARIRDFVTEEIPSKDLRKRSHRDLAFSSSNFCSAISLNT